MEFMIGPKDLRAELYKNFQVTECVIKGAHRYLAACPRCSRILATIPKQDVPVDATPLIVALEHVRCHGPIAHTVVIREKL